jgi:hypothetical protein
MVHCVAAEAVLTDLIERGDTDFDHRDLHFRAFEVKTLRFRRA